MFGGAFGTGFNNTALGTGFNGSLGTGFNGLGTAGGAFGNGLGGFGTTGFPSSTSNFPGTLGGTAFGNTTGFPGTSILPPTGGLSFGPFGNPGAATPFPTLFNPTFTSLSVNPLTGTTGTTGTAFTTF